MSLENALAFLDLVERDEVLRSEVAEIASTLDLLPLTRLAARRGLPCDPEALRKAWRKRRMLKEAVMHARRSQENRPDAG